MDCRQAVSWGGFMAGVDVGSGQMSFHGAAICMLICPGAQACHRCPFGNLLSARQCSVYDDIHAGAAAGVHIMLASLRCNQQQSSSMVHAHSCCSLLHTPMRLLKTFEVEHTERPVGARGSMAICLVLMTERGNSVKVTPEKSPAPYTRNLARSSL